MAQLHFLSYYLKRNKWVLLNPIRAKVTLGLRVLSVDDLGFRHRGGTLFMAYLRTKESLAGQSGSVPLSTLGVEALP